MRIISLRRSKTFSYQFSWHCRHVSSLNSTAQDGINIPIRPIIQTHIISEPSTIMLPESARMVCTPNPVQITGEGWAMYIPDEYQGVKPPKPKGLHRWLVSHPSMHNVFQSALSLFLRRSTKKITADMQYRGISEWGPQGTLTSSPSSRGTVRLNA